jgi:hypothetical protein
MPVDGRRSPLLIMATLALRVARGRLRTYGSIKSRKDLTQPRLVTCLVLRAYLKATCSDFCDQLAVASELRAALGPRKGPDDSTLCKFAAKADVPAVREAMLATLAKQIDALDTSTRREVSQRHDQVASERRRLPAALARREPYVRAQTDHRPGPARPPHRGDESRGNLQRPRLRPPALAMTYRSTKGVNGAIRN